MNERKRFFVIKRLFLFFLLLCFLVLTKSQVMAEWSCPFIETNTSIVDDTLIFTINLANPPLPNDISQAYMSVAYDPEKLSFNDFDSAGCLVAYVGLAYPINPDDIGEVPSILFGSIPNDTDGGCLFKIVFSIIGENVKDPFVYELDGDFCPDGVCWCATPMTCHISISPKEDTVYSEENIDFTTEVLYCDNPPSCEWDAECNSSIVPNDTDSCKALYTAGVPKLSCEDTVTVTDIGNEHVNEEYSMATAGIYINASILIKPEKATKPAGYPKVGSGSSVKFEADTSFCHGPTNNAWSVESSIGSEINHVTGLYQAGREFTTCDDAVDIVKVNAVCLNDGVERIAEESVTIPACKLTINPSSITVASGDTVTFFNSLDSCCTTPPEPEYSWELESAIGSTIIDNPPNSRFLYRAGNNTGLQNFAETITVSDSNHLDATDIAIVTILPLKCASDEDCDDGEFCNGNETCVDNLCQPGNDPCPEGTTCDEASNTCKPLAECVDDEDCDDGKFCNGNETCVDNLCQPGNDPCPGDGLYCTGEESCDEEQDACFSTGDPCPENTTCIEETDQCTTIPPPSVITATPDPIMRSRWIILPAFITIAGEGTSFSQSTSRVSYTPKNALLPLPALVLGPELIWQMVLVNPPWLAGSPEDPQTVTATVDGAVDEFEIQLLPFILDQR